MASVFFKLFLEIAIRAAQMRHIRQRVSQLLCRKRASPPIGKPAVLVDFSASGFADKRFIANRVTETTHHGGNLRVDGRRRDNAGLLVEYLDILSTAMHHLGHFRIYQEIVKRLQIDALGERVNHAFKTVARCLNEAEFRPECMFAQKFRIDRDKFACRECGAQVFQLGLLCNQIHGHFIKNLGAFVAI